MAMHNLRTMVVDRTYGIGQALDVGSVYGRLGWGTIGLQEIRRSGCLAFIQDGWLAHCSGECGVENSGKKRQAGIGLAAKSSITHAPHPPESVKGYC